MAYGLIYQSSFDNLAERRYRVDILKKDYSADIIPILLAGRPAIHTWQTDEAKPAVKGSSLIVNLYNTGEPDSGGTTFAANVELFYFPISLYYAILINFTTFVPVVGVPFTISGHSDPAANGTWVPTVVDPGVGGGWIVQVAGLATTTSPEDVTISQGVTIGSVSMEDFYSEEDDMFKVELYEDSQLKFTGFLVQDDCSEQMADFTHEISLSFNDNLGLLKDLALDAIVPNFGGWLATAYLDFDSPVPDNFIYLFDSDFVPAIGVPFTITNHIDPTANDTWTPIDVVDYRNGNYIVQVADLAFASDTVAYPVRITGAGSINLDRRNTLLNIIATCIMATGLELDTYIYDNLFEESHDTADSPLAQTFIDGRVFNLTGDAFDNCYDVLTEILNRFRLTLFQADGSWHIVRWDETRYGPVNYFRYDAQFNLLDTGTLPADFTTGFQEDVYPETGLRKSIFRPFKYTKENFNYRQPESLIINADLQDLGTFDHQDTDATYNYDYYEFPEDSKWLHFFPGDPKVDISKIVVVTEIATGVEKDRYVYQPKTGPGGGVGLEYRAAVQFNDIQVSAGDTFEFKISIRAASNTGGDNILYHFGFLLCPDESSYYGLVNGLGPFGWAGPFGAPNGAAPALIAQVTLAANAEEFTDYVLSSQGTQLKVPKFPVDGVLRIRVYGSNDNSASQPDVDVIWKNINLTITQNINDSAYIIGHTHLNEQDRLIKNNETITPLLDDSPRSSITGTLFRVPYVGLVAQRTVNWYRLHNPTEELKLGQITTFEQLFWRRLPRTKLEGTFYGVYGLSMLAVLNNTALPDLNFIFGSLEIDYKNNSLNCTMWEIYEDGEEDDALASDYTFTYLYDIR